jgi:hypothetical protein
VARLKPVRHDEELSLVEHLDELRSRLLVSAAALIPALVVCGWKNHVIIAILNRPLPKGVHPITLSPTEPFLTTATLVVYAALLIALPVILYQAYAFVLPAFSPPERRVALPLMLLAPALFAALVVTQALADGQRLAVGADTVGVAAGGLVAWRTGSVIGCVVVAAAVTALLRAL